MTEPGNKSGFTGNQSGRSLKVKERVKTAKKRTPQSNRWLERQLNDPYVKRAHAEGYRSRAAYKLIELDEKFGFLKGKKTIVDLGVAPGGWLQVIRKRLPQAKVAGIDLLPVDPLDGVNRQALEGHVVLFGRIGLGHDGHAET